MSFNPNFIYKDFDESITHNYNKIWNWYLKNLKTGEFEYILNNDAYSQELNHLIDDLNNDITLILIIPNIINSTILLQDLLSKFFQHSASAENDAHQYPPPLDVIITNLGALSQSQSSIIMATTNTTTLADSKSTQYSFGTVSSYNQTIELNSIISGESGYTPSFNDPTISTPPTPTPPSHASQSSDASDVIDDSESSIDSYRPPESIPPSPKYSLTRVTTIQNDGSLTHVPNSPISSEIHSPVIKVQTKESEEIESMEDDDEDDDDDVQSSSMVGDVENIDANSIYSDDSSVDSLDYVPSMITARTKKLNIRYKLVLNSILFTNGDKEKRTAIRQSDENGICDDWLLYDAAFRMDNLQLLDLRGVIEMMKFKQKILFYDLVIEKMGPESRNNDEFEEEDDLDDFEDVQDNDLSVVEFVGKEEVDENEHEDVDDHGDHDDEYGTEGTSIRFTQSNQTTITPSIKLSKTNTTNTIRTNHGSIKSEMNLYKPDPLFSRVERSKSTPYTSTKMKKFKLKHGNNSHSNDRCIIT